MGVKALSAGAVARRLGVAVTTLRTWHQRYGLGPSQHEPGQHRRYTTKDLHRLEVMLRLTAQGVPPAEAAAWARRTPLLVDPSAPRPGAANSAARGLTRAAMRLDVTDMRGILEAAVAAQGVIGAWTQVAVPVLVSLGERFQATERFVEVEHLLSRCVTEVLATVPRPSDQAPRLLLAAADDEQHVLPLEALDAALAQAGVAARFLGGRVPPRALADAITRTGPLAVVLWSQLPNTGDPTQLTRVVAHPHRPLLVAAAGPGWPTELPDDVVRLISLAEAVAILTDVAS